jgi:group II intron reverse transcriptase/maturase
VRDRVAQAALKLVLEPIFEADFQPCCYGFRPKRRAQDAIAEIHYLASRSYEWVLEADIEACFDTIAHAALLDRVRGRVGDKHVLRLVKAFLKAGLLSADGAWVGTVTGTPQGGILSPLLANIALAPLDEHFTRRWQEMGTMTRRRGLRKRGGATYRLVRYADDFVVMVAGTREHAKALQAEVAVVLAPLGLRLSQAKTHVRHLDEGFDFLGWRIQRRRKRGTGQRQTYTYPSKKALLSVTGRVRTLTRRSAHPGPVGPAAPAQPGAARVERLLPARSVQTHLRLPRRVRLAPGRRLAAQTAPTAGMEPPAPPSPSRVAAHRAGRDHAVQPGNGHGLPLPLPRRQDPDTLEGSNDQHRRMTPARGLWRAGCSGTGTSGSAGGAWKRTG